MNTARKRMKSGEMPRQWMASWRMIVVTGVLLCVGTAHAQYRCIQAGGGVSYQQTPCADDARSKRMQLSSTATSTPGGSEDRTDWAAVVRGQPQAGNAARGADSAARNCPSPQQIKSMEFEASKIANRHNGGMQADLARARACR